MNVFKLFLEKRKCWKIKGEMRKGEKEKEGRREQRKVEERSGYFHISTLLCVSKGWVGEQIKSDTSS